MSTHDHIQGEPVMKVEDPAVLKAMDIVWLRPCNICQKRHRFTLLKTNQVKYWDILPAPSCQPAERTFVLDPANATRHGHLWLVINPPRESEDGTHRTKLLERVRR